MIAWLFDQWWLRKNRDALRQLDEEMAATEAMRVNLEKKMTDLGMDQDKWWRERGSNLMGSLKCN